MSRTQKALSLVLVASAVAWAVRQEGCILPEVLPAVDSPLPAEGRHLFIVHESQADSTVRAVYSSDFIRNDDGLAATLEDYDVAPTEAVWTDAWLYAKEKSAGRPYYVGRNGRKICEGFLEGTADQMAAQLKTALESIE